MFSQTQHLKPQDQKCESCGTWKHIWRYTFKQFDNFFSRNFEWIWSSELLLGRQQPGTKDQEG